ncbi:MAG TPA: hypothetical protein VMW52_00455, partial [Phycisphaerae bacterium]|nr:hypothetical protein [Phycisphaerae bacterium]
MAGSENGESSRRRENLKYGHHEAVLGELVDVYPISPGATNRPSWAIVALLERKREILARRARERQATSTGGRNPQLVANLPQAEGRTRDALAKEVGGEGG